MAELTSELLPGSVVTWQRRVSPVRFPWMIKDRLAVVTPRTTPRHLATGTTDSKPDKDAFDRACRSAQPSKTHKNMLRNTSAVRRLNDL